MSKPPIVLLQQRDFGQKMNVSFEFVSRNFMPLLKAMLFIPGPAALLAGIANGMFQSRLLISTKSVDPFSMLNQYWALEYLFVIVFSVISYFLAYATVSSFITLYEERGSSADITPGAVWEKITCNIGASIGAMIISLLLTLVGFVFFVLPGIYIAIALQFFMMITIREKLSAIDALHKSRKLIVDKWWSTFGLIMIMSMVAGLIAIVFQLPLMITTVFNTLGLTKGYANAKSWIILTNAISILGSTIVQSLVWVALAFQYFNLVERQTGSGLAADIDALGKGDWERPRNEEQY